MRPAVMPASALFSLIRSGVDNAHYAGAVVRTYAVSLAIGLLGKDVAQAVLVALLPVKSSRSRKIVGVFANAIASLIEAA